MTEFSQLTVRNNLGAGHQHIKNTKEMKFQLQSYLTVKKAKPTNNRKKLNTAKNDNVVTEHDDLEADLSCDSAIRDLNYLQKHMNKSNE